MRRCFFDDVYYSHDVVIKCIGMVVNPSAYNSDKLLWRLKNIKMSSVSHYLRHSTSTYTQVADKHDLIFNKKNSRLMAVYQLAE